MVRNLSINFLGARTDMTSVLDFVMTTKDYPVGQKVSRPTRAAKKQLDDSYVD